jgi:hypothetical protein
MTMQYAEARTQAEYVIADWDSSRFASAVKGVIEFYLGTSDPVLENTYVVEGAEAEGEKLTHFDRLEPLLQRLSDEKAYVGCNVFVKGPRGAALRLELFDNRQQLRIKSSFAPGKFSELIKSLNKRNLGLAPPARAPVVARSAWQEFIRGDSLLGKIALAVIPALLTGIGFLAERSIRDVEMRLTVPRAAGNQEYQAGCIPVAWEIVTKEWFDDARTVIDGVGDLHIWPTDGGGDIKVVKDHRSGARIYVPPRAGGWSLFVRDPNLERKTAETSFHVRQSQDPASEDTAPFTPCPPGTSG